MVCNLHSLAFIFSHAGVEIWKMYFVLTFLALGFGDTLRPYWGPGAELLRIFQKYRFLQYKICAFIAKTFLYLGSSANFSYFLGCAKTSMTEYDGAGTNAQQVRVLKISFFGELVHECHATIF